MIKQLHVENFKCLRDVTVDLEPLTVLIGPNDSGKTSLMEAIGLISDAARTDETSLRVGPEHMKLVRRPSDRSGLRITAVAELSDHTDLKYRLEIDWNEYSRAWINDSLWDGSECVACWDGNESRREYRRRPVDTDPSRSLFQVNEPELFDWNQYADRLAATPRYRFQPDELRSPCKPSSVPSLLSSGSNLADALHSLINGPDPSIRGKIDSALHDEIPTLRSVFTPVDSEGRLGLEYVLAGDDPGPVRIPSQQVSDGALLLTAFLTLAWQNTPGIVLIEEPENGLHPRRRQSLITLLRKITTGEVGNRPRQVILTTHSPYLLDHVEPEEVRVLTIGADGASLCGRLVDHPQYEKWKYEFAPGEMWSMFGEQWLEPTQPAHGTVE